MPAPLRHSDLSTILGTWPVLPSYSGVPTVLPRTLIDEARILGTLRETAAGYDVDGRSFRLHVDGNPYFTVSFSYGAFLPLSEVISQINTASQSAIGDDVAFRDNGFLLLKSPNTGEGSYLRLETDPSSSPTNVFYNLGLMSEIESFGGDLAQTPHADPDRQVATHGQLSMAEGENLDAKVFNRALAQVAFNNDRHEGMLSRKRLAVRRELSIGSYSPGAEHGVQFTGGNLVYVGKTPSPSIEDLERLFAVLDDKGRELSYDHRYPIAPSQNATWNDDTTGTKQLVTCSYFTSGPTEDVFEKGNYYIYTENFSTAGTELNGALLKIIEVNTSSGIAVVETIDPTTGETIAPFAHAGILIDIIRLDRSKVVVDGVFADVAAAVAGTPRLEANPVVKRATLTPSRIEHSNRVVCVGEDFLSSPAVGVGDIVEWANATINLPYSNNGIYRVSRVIDKETLELVAEDWGAAYLNPNQSGGSAGDFDIRTDGFFVEDPFVRFADSNDHPPPNTGETFEIAYLRGTTFLDATDDDPALFQSDVRFTQEASRSITEAITRLHGPSANSLDDVLYGDHRINLESINIRLNREHYNYDDAEKPGSPNADDWSFGRHRDVRPDTIDMWYWEPPDPLTPRVRFRGERTLGHGGSTFEYTDKVFDVVDQDGNEMLVLDSDGRMRAGGMGYGDIRVFRDYEIHGPSDDPDHPVLGGDAIFGERIIWRGTHRWAEADGDCVGHSLAVQDSRVYLDTSSAATGRLDGIIGARVDVSSASTTASWADYLRFIHLDGILQKSTTDYSDDKDAVGTMYGIHVDYSLSGNFKIEGNHYGIYVGNIQRAGTAVSSTGDERNYAIYTNEGLLRFKDYIYAGDDWDTADDAWKPANYLAKYDLDSDDIRSYLFIKAGYSAGTTNSAIRTIRPYLSVTGGNHGVASILECQGYLENDASVSTYYGISLSLTTTDTTSVTGDIIGVRSGVAHHGTGTRPGNAIQYLGPSMQTTGTWGTDSTAHFYGEGIVSTGGTHHYGLYLGNITGGTTNNYGIYVTGASGTGAYALYVAAGEARFQSTVRVIGTTYTEGLLRPSSNIEPMNDTVWCGTSTNHFYAGYFRTPSGTSTTYTMYCYNEDGNSGSGGYFRGAGGSTSTTYGITVYGGNGLAYTSWSSSRWSGKSAANFDAGNPISAEVGGVWYQGAGAQAMSVDASNGADTPTGTPTLGNGAGGGGTGMTVNGGDGGDYRCTFNSGFHAGSGGNGITSYGGSGGSGSTTYGANYGSNGHGIRALGGSAPNGSPGPQAGHGVYGSGGSVNLATGASPGYGGYFVGGLSTNGSSINGGIGVYGIGGDTYSSTEPHGGIGGYFCGGQGTAGTNGPGGYGLWVRSGIGNIPGNYHAPLHIEPNGTLPSTTAGNVLAGDICVVSGKLYIYTGTAWVVVGTQT